jgi:circadian clock protein KaiB
MTEDTGGAMHFDFELFIAGDAPNSARALSNLRTLCELRVPNRYTIAVVDVFQDPNRALQEKIFLTPTLLRIAPGPERRIVGTLSHADEVADALGLASEAA